MSERRNYDLAGPFARGKPLDIRKHARDGMEAERPAVRVEDLVRALEESDHDDGQAARKRIGRRTILVRYEEAEDRISVRGVSATRRRLAP
jgi:hypothetical protein